MMAKEDDPLLFGMVNFQGLMLNFEDFFKPIFR